MRRRHLVWKWRLNRREGVSTKVTSLLTFRAEKRLGHHHSHAIEHTEYQTGTDACDYHRGGYHHLFIGCL